MLLRLGKGLGEAFKGRFFAWRRLFIGNHDGRLIFAPPPPLPAAGILTITGSIGRGGENTSRGREASLLDPLKFLPLPASSRRLDAMICGWERAGAREITCARTVRSGFPERKKPTLERRGQEGG